MHKSSALQTTASITQKTTQALVEHVYSQIGIAMFSSLFCGSIAFIGVTLNSFAGPNLTIWAMIYLMGIAFRTIIGIAHERDHQSGKHYRLWQRLYILNSFIGGSCWGLAAVLLIPHATLMQQTLILFMLAGVTGGSIPLSSAIPKANVAFLMTALIPFIIVFAKTEYIVFKVFDLSLVLYLVYSIMLTYRNFHNIRNSIVLQYEKEALLNDVYQTKLELEKINRKLHEAATHDPLTNVANRNLFRSSLEKEIRNAEKDDSIFALLYLDIDNFKMINDQYGHHAGDIILLAISDRLRDYFGKGKLIARLGGDEFIILVNKVSYLKQVKSIASELCRQISDPIRIDQSELIVSVSIGVSIFPADGRDTDELLRAADKSMYFVKQHGGGSFYLNTSFREATSPGCNVD